MTNPNKAYKKIGQMIEKARKAKGFSQEELGKKLGYSGAAISYFESGARRVNLYDLERISKILEVPTSQLLHLSEQPIQGLIASDGLVMLGKSTDSVYPELAIATEDTLGANSRLDVSVTDSSPYQRLKT